VNAMKLELDRYIGSTHNRGRLWDNRNHWHSVTIGWWPVHADVSGWGYSPNSPRHELYRPPMQYYSRFHAVFVFEEAGCSSITLLDQ